MNRQMQIISILGENTEFPIPKSKDEAVDLFNQLSKLLPPPKSFQFYHRLNSESMTEFRNSIMEYMVIWDFDMISGNAWCQCYYVRRFSEKAFEENNQTKLEFIEPYKLVAIGSNKKLRAARWLQADFIGFEKGYARIRIGENEFIVPFSVLGFRTDV